MPSQHDALTAFFKQYEHSSNTLNIQSLLNQFTDPFTVTTPEGPQIIRAADFAAFLPRRKALFDSLGCQEASLDSLHASHLNPHFVMVDTTWRMRFAPPNQPPDNFGVTSSFLVYLNGSAMKIFLYMPHQDIMQVLRERGILTTANTEATPA